jgi:WD40 repeat protein
MSVDVYPNSAKYFVTASFNSEGDSGIRFWELQVEGPALKVKPNYLYDLNGGHTKTVNCVRFSPNGQFLASGADDQLVIIWQLKSVPVEFGKLDEQIQWG